MPPKGTIIWIGVGCSLSITFLLTICLIVIYMRMRDHKITFHFNSPLCNKLNNVTGGDKISDAKSPLIMYQFMDPTLIPHPQMVETATQPPYKEEFYSTYSDVEEVTLREKRPPRLSQDFDIDISHNRNLSRERAKRYESLINYETPIARPQSASDISLRRSSWRVSQSSLDIPRLLTYEESGDLGKINPKLYQSSEENVSKNVYPQGHLGRVWFAVEYVATEERLVVTILKAANLKCPRLKRRFSGFTSSENTKATCDPAVRLTLLPNTRRRTTVQTKTKRRTRNPVFAESVVFQLPHKSLPLRTLQLTVVDAERSSKVSHVIGQIMYSLNEHKWTDDAFILWRDLEPAFEEASFKTPHVKIALTFNPGISKLSVAVYELINPGWTLYGNDQIFIKVTFLQKGKVVKARRTDCHQNVENILFQESFSIVTDADVLDQTCVTLSLRKKIGSPKDRTIGTFALGGFMFTRGDNLKAWEEMLQIKGNTTISWHYFT